MAADNFYWAEDNKPVSYSTGVRLFFILLLAMAPLALIAFFATIQIDRNAAAARNDAAASALNLSALRLNNALTRIEGDVLQWSQQIGNTASAPQCARLAAMPKQSGFSAARLFQGRAGTPTCTIGLLRPAIERQIAAGSPDNLQISVQHEGLIMHVRGSDNRLAGSVYFSNADLLDLADPRDNLPLSRLGLLVGGEQLLVKQLPIRRENRLETEITAAQTVLGAPLTLQLPKPPAVSPNYFIRLLLIMMTVFAAMIGWVIVNRMLLQPLKALQSKMHNFGPGADVSALSLSGMIAPEIRELDKVFDHLAGKVNDDKMALADSLDEQIKLTREVHHRVKNNLQIITSLLNLHGRGIADPELKEHYTMIQRRVDALAVVHRNHFAQGEAAKGISLRALINEILSSFRTGFGNDITTRTDISCNQHKVEQDIAMPVAFLLTELLEVIETLDGDKNQHVAISADADATGKLMRLKLASNVLKGERAVAMLAQHNISKVITGLCRQLRTDCVHDSKHGHIAIAVPVMPGNQSEDALDASDA